MPQTIEEAFAKAQEVQASNYDLASSLAIITWREMNNWQGEDKDHDFIKMHAWSRRCQEEIKTITRGIESILKWTGYAQDGITYPKWNKVVKCLSELYEAWCTSNLPGRAVIDKMRELVESYDDWLG
jgi:hypothetical protein